MPGLSGSQKAYKQARYGIARYASTRYGVYIPSQVITIGGVDRSSKIFKGSVGITLNTNDVPDTARFTLMPNPGFTPTEDQLVKIGHGTAVNAAFSGVITKVVHRRRPALQSPWFDITCTDETRILDSHLVTGAWANMDAAAIVIDALQRFAPSFTYFNVVSGIATISIWTAENEKMSSFIRRVASRINGSCYWSRSDVHLYGPGGETGSRAPTPPRTITDSLATLIGPPLGDVPSHLVDGTQKRNRIIVDGKRTKTPVGTPDGATSVVVSASAPVDYLIVGGGGAGGANPASGGGGGGGGIQAGTITLTAGAYTVTIGAGGATVGANGGDSSVSGITTAVGGGGGGGSVAPGHTNGSNGGSGGGGCEVSAAGGTASQGQNGGSGVGIGGGNAAGGGGGAGGGGVNGGAFGIGGAGGVGAGTSISGSLQYYCGGGGGNGLNGNGAGGTGGGGNGGAGGAPSTAGAANTGGGGGGSSDNNAARSAGGSGIVILRYPTGLVSATGGVITTGGGYTVHTFTAGGTFTLSTITVTAPIPAVKTLPVDDHTQFIPAPPFVRLAQQIFSLLSVLGPTIQPGANRPGSTLSSDVAAGAISLPVTDVTQFGDSHGWVKAGEQYIYWDSKSAGALTDVPAAGFGSVVAALKSGTAVSWYGSIQISNSGVIFSPPLIPDSDVVGRSVYNDTTAQAALIVQRGGGDGIIEEIIDDSSLDVTGQAAAAAAALGANANANVIVSWTTFDQNAIASVPQVINRTLPEALSLTVQITRVDISYPAPSHLPVRRCTGSIVRQPDLIDVLTVNPR